MEKTGATQKKVYDFNTAAMLEVCIKGIWYSTTANHFRSFDGDRRITQPIKQPGIRDTFADVVYITEEYNGPVYVLQTNLEVIRMDTQTIVTSPYIETKSIKSIAISNRI